MRGRRRAGRPPASSAPFSSSSARARAAFPLAALFAAAALAGAMPDAGEEERSRRLAPYEGRTEALAPVLMVSNFEHRTGSVFATPLAGDERFAIAFATGSYSGGYALDEVAFRLEARDQASRDADMVAHILSVGADGNPADTLYTLTPPASRLPVMARSRRFSAPAGATLSASTTYFAVLGVTSENHTVDVTVTESDDENSDYGWTIANAGRSASTGANWSSSSSRMLVRIWAEGPSSPPPSVSSVAISSGAGSDDTYAIGDSVKVTVTFTEDVDVTGTPQIVLDVGGEDKTLAYYSGTGMAEIVFAGEVAENDLDANGVSIASNALRPNGGTIRKKDSATEDAALGHVSLAAQPAHKVDGVRPTLEGAATSTDGMTIALVFSEPLLASAGDTPTNARFAVEVESVAAPLSGAPAVSGAAATLALATAAAYGEEVTVAYTDESGGDDDAVVQDLAGNDAATFAAETVENNVPPNVVSVAIASSPGTDGVYAIGDEIVVTATFNGAVDVSVSGGGPYVELTVGTEPERAGCAAAVGVTVVTCSYAVEEGDLDANGVSFAQNALGPGGGTIRKAGSTTVDAVLAHGAAADDDAHKVDGVRPTFESAAVSSDGAAIQLAFSEPLLASAGDTPTNARFAVNVANAAATLSGAPAVSGASVTLTLATAVTTGQTVTVAYTDETAGDDDAVVQDLAGNDAAAFGEQTVINKVGATTVSSLAIASNAGTDETYAIGDSVKVTVTFSEAVDVTGTPQIVLDVGGKDKPLNYDTGTGSAQLVFAGYAVVENDLDANGVSIASNALRPNGGTIRKKDSATENAALGHVSLAAQPAHKVDGVRPALSSAAVSADGTEIALAFNETLGSAAVPADSFAVTVASSPRGVYAASASGAEITLTLQSAVGAGETVTVAYTDTAQDEAVVEDAAGNDLAAFDAQAVTNRSTVPAVYPRQGEVIWAATITPSVNTLDLRAFGGGLATVTSYADEAIFSSFAPSRISGVGTFSYAETNYTIRQIAFTRITDNSNMVTNAYSILSLPSHFPEAPDDLLILEVDGAEHRFDEASQTISDLGNRVYNWNPFPVPPWTDGQTVSVKLIARSTAPAVSSVALTSDPGDDETYAIGDSLKVTVTFSEAVDVTGAPQIVLDAGGEDKPLPYYSGTGFAEIVFAGEVAENDEDADGVSIASDALRLSGGTIRQAGSTTSDAVIAHTAVAAADAHKIDGVRPTPVTSGDDAPRTSADGSSIILFFSETLSQATAPADSFAVTVDGVPRSVDEASANGAAVTLALESPVAGGEAVTVAYTDGSAANDDAVVQDTAGNDAAAFDALAVRNNVPSADAALGSFSLTGPDGEDLVLNFVPETTDYSLTVAHDADTLTVEASANHPEATLEYLDGDGNTLADADENADGLQAALEVGPNAIKVKVTAQDPNATRTYTVDIVRQEPEAPPAVSSVALTSDPGDDETYAIGDSLKVTVTFSEAVDVTGAPQIVLDAGGEDKPLPYYSGTGFAEIVFAGEVAENDEDADGVSIASDALRLSGGTIRQAGSTTSDAVIAHTAVAAADAHKIDGVRPTPVTSGDDAPRTSADGSSIILFFSETLSQATAPADSFAVTVDGVPRSVDEASANGAAVTLALESPVAGGEAVTVAYTDGSAANDDAVVQDTAGNDAAAFDALAVRNNVPSADAALGSFSLTGPDGEDLVLNFVPETTDYSLTVAHDADTLTVEASANHPEATLEYLDGDGNTLADADENADGLQAALEVGPNAIKVKVTAQDPNATRTYTVDIVRQEPEAPPAVASVAISSGAGPDETYAIGDSVKVAVTFTEAVDVTGAPQIVLDVGGEDKALSYESGTGGETIVFSGYAVAENDLDADGIAIAQDALDPNGAAIRKKGSATVAAVITHPALAPQPAHAVDGVRPTPAASGGDAPATSTDGTQIALVFNETLSSQTAPADSFAVTVDGVPRSVDEASANGAAVTLALESPVAGGEAVTVAYTDGSAANDDAVVQDAAGNDAAAFGPLAVRNNVSSSDAALAALSLSGAALAPAFHPDSTSYAATVAHTVAVTTVAAAANHAEATLEYLDGDGNALADADENADGLQAALAPGANEIAVQVTAQDGDAARTYSVVVTRLGPPVVAPDDPQQPPPGTPVVAPDDPQQSPPGAPVGVTSAESEEELPEEVLLMGNYPNPFNPVTTIRYALPQAARVRLAVYDMLGREVAALVDGPQPAGRHAARFDANALPSGAYVYRLQADNEIIARVMTLVK